ncbi:MAG: OsmC family protein [Gammaproteobacteria bacterium]|nr:OsmC family protein [Gammaproteobacteria bacterium]
MQAEIVNVEFPGGKRVDARIGKFLIETDQSIEHGGDAAAPEPFDLFLASIANCAGIFALSFCQKRELSTAGLALQLACERDPAKKMITRMTLELKLPEGFPEKYRGGIQRAMDLCTVKKHMFDPPEFDIQLR